LNITHADCQCHIVSCNRAKFAQGVLAAGMLVADVLALAADMLVADVLVLADVYKPYKC
jgi:hypothetical protein